MMHPQFPLTLGMDFSGVVQQVGEGGGEKLIPSNLRQGDEVYGQAAVTIGGSGAFAEMAVTNIHGGAGGIGSIAVALAKNLGAYVSTTLIPVDKQFVVKLGADEVIDYRMQAFEDLVHEYDAVFDTVGGETYSVF